MTQYVLPVALTMLAAFLFVTEIRMFLLSRSIRQVEKQIIALYRRKIDKIPALIESMRSIESHSEATDELKSIHRKAIAASSDRIYDVLETNSLLTERFSFLMRLSLVVRDLRNDGNFIHTRETIAVLEESVVKAIREHSAQSRAYNSLVRAKNATLVGMLLPGSRRIVL